MYHVNNSIAQIYVINYFKAVQNTNNTSTHPSINALAATNSCSYDRMPLIIMLTTITTMMIATPTTRDLKVIESQFQLIL